MSPPTMKVRSSSGSRSCSTLRVSTVKDGPRPAHLEVADRQAVVAGGRQPAELEPGGRPGIGAQDLLVRRHAPRA
jgi:hypothetical protein